MRYPNCALNSADRADAEHTFAEGMMSYCKCADDVRNLHFIAHTIYYDLVPLDACLHGHQYLPPVIKGGATRACTANCVLRHSRPEGAPPKPDVRQSTLSIAHTLYELTALAISSSGGAVYAKDVERHYWDHRSAHYYPISRGIFEDADLLKLCAETDMLTVFRPSAYMRVSTTIPAMWAAPLGRVFNNAEYVCLVVELPGRWGIPALIEDMPEAREKCISDSQDYYGTFITTIGCMTPRGYLDEEPIA
jgi:hypothetical protein